MNTSTLEQNQAIIDEYIKKYAKTVSPDNNPMQGEFTDATDARTVRVKLPSKEEFAEKELERRNKESSLSYENNELLKSIDNRLANLEKGMGILLSHMQNIEFNINQPF